MLFADAKSAGPLAPKEDHDRTLADGHSRGTNMRQLDGSATIHDHGHDASRHAVQFYERDPFLIDAVSRFVEEGLAGGENVAIIAISEHQKALDEKLQARGLNLVAAATAGRLIVLDAAEILRR